MIIYQAYYNDHAMKTSLYWQ